MQNLVVVSDTVWAYMSRKFRVRLGPAAWDGGMAEIRYVTRVSLPNFVAVDKTICT